MDLTSFDDLKNLLSSEGGYGRSFRPGQNRLRNKGGAATFNPGAFHHMGKGRRSIIGSTIKLPKGDDRVDFDEGE